MLESLIVSNCKGVRVLLDLQRLSRLRALEFLRCEFEDLSGLINLTGLKKLQIQHCKKLEALPDLRDLASLEELYVEGCVRLRYLLGNLGLRNLKSLLANGHPWLYENLGLGLPRLTGLRILHVSDSGFEYLQGLAACSQLCSLVCSGCPIHELPDLSNFPELSNLIVRDCLNLMKLTCTGPSSPKFEHLDVHGCMRLQALPDLTNSLKLRSLNVSNSGVLLSAQLIRDMKVHWPSIRLVT